MAKKSFTEKVQSAADMWMIRTKDVRTLVYKMYKQYANGFYDGGESPARRPMPLNLIDRGVQIIAPFLVTNNPRVSISARYGASKPGLKAFAVVMELAMAHLFDEIHLAQKTLRPLIIDSLFSMGITKTGIWTNENIELGDTLAAVGQQYCDRINFNDYIGDIAARNREEMMIEGNRYRLPEEFVKTSGFFKNYDRVVQEIETEKDTDPKSIFNKGETEYNDLREFVELQDIWIPDEGVIITLPLTGQGTKILRTVEWDGPEAGPYDVLTYKVFPESIIPIPPVYIWLDISKTLNVMCRKMVQNCEREKSLGVFQQGDEASAQIVKDAEHGDLIGLTNPDTIKEVTIGGFEPKSMQFLQYLEHQFAISYSNLYGIGGRGTQANTLGQEQMLQYNATRALDDMVEQFHTFVRSITKKLAYFLWTDPLKQIPIIRRIANVDLEVNYSEATKEGDFFDYSFDIDPYSLSRMNPEMRFQKMMELITGVVLPLAPLAMQQGSYPDVNEIVQEAGRYLHIPSLDSWWKSVVPPEGQNPYELMQGSVSPGESPGQRGGAFESSSAAKSANSRQQQTSTRANKPSPSNTSKK